VTILFLCKGYWYLIRMNEKKEGVPILVSELWLGISDPALLLHDSKLLNLQIKYTCKAVQVPFYIQGKTYGSC